MTEQPVHACMCCALDERELLAVWHHRATPIFRRAAMRARRVDVDRLAGTLLLVQQLSRGEPEALKPVHAHRSHHLKDCPAAARNRGRVFTPPAPLELVEQARRTIPVWRLR